MNLKRKIFLFLLFIPYFSAVFSQKAPVKFENYTFDYGDINDWTDIPAVFVFENISSSPVALVVPSFPAAINVNYPKYYIQPGQKDTVKVFFKPSVIGSFKKEIVINTSASDSPVSLYIKGNVKSLVPCPDFSSNMGTRKSVFAQDVRVVNDSTKKPVPGALVRIKNDNGQMTDGRTNHDGFFARQIKPGLYDIIANADGFVPFAKTMYLNKNSGTYVIFLVPLKTPDVKENTADNELINRIYNTPTKIETKDTVTKVIPKVQKILPVVVKHDSLKKDELSVNEFSPNNIVFLIDASGSMRRKDKLPLLKGSIKKLVTVLRNIDKVSLISYKYVPTVHFLSVTADKKDSINKAIDSLKASGYTRGIAGLNKAYETATENLIPGGNNQVIIATDGEFESKGFTDADMEAIIKKYADKGIILSVIGFGLEKDALRRMKTMAAKGKGNYLHISSQQESDKILIEEIKANSRKLNH